MQITDTANTLRMIKAVAGVSSLALVEASPDRPFSLRLEPGQEVRGEVVASLVNGRFLVKIAGELLDMNLPASIKPGETVQLTFMAEKPRLTFSLDQQKSSAPVSLSDAGRWLTLLARTPLGEQLRPEDVLKAVQASVRNAILVTADEVPGQLLQRLTPGQQMSGSVLAELPNGRFQITIADQLMEMALPKGTRPGNELQLMFISERPQPSFLLVPQNSTAPLAETSRWLSFAARTATAAYPPPSEPLIPASVQQTPSPASPQTAPAQEMTVPVGQPAQASVKQPATAQTPQPPAQPGPPTAPATTQPGAAPMAQPVTPSTIQPPATAAQAAPEGETAAQTARSLALPAGASIVVATSEAAISTTDLAGRLRDALSRSGVFYESHLADLTAGKGTVEQLLREPQGKLSPLTTPPPSPLPDAAAKLPSTPQSSGVMTGTAPLVKGETTGLPEPADSRTLPVVRQQLELLQTGVFMWQGEAWAGQPMEWSVGEREAEEGDTPGRRWSTTVSLDLPRLGQVKAELSLKDKRMKLTVETGNVDTAALLEENGGSLRERLAANGLILTSMGFTHEE